MPKKKRPTDPPLPPWTLDYTLPAYGFVESPPFTRQVDAYLTDDEYAAFQWDLAQNPSAGDVIPGTGGVRKVRWSDPRRRKGKRGGTRIVYFILVDDSLLYLLTIYDKDEMNDLNSHEKKLLKKLVDDEKKARIHLREKAKKS